MIPDAPPEPSGSATESAALDGLVADDAKTAELKPAIVDAIRTVYDPEIPVNIWELGLIYDVIRRRLGVAGVRMTLTAPGCPAAQSLPGRGRGEGQGGARRHRREGRRRVGTGLDEGSHVGRREAQLGMW